MQVDFLTMACFRDQLDGFLGARVQQVVLPDSRSIALELYAGKRLNLYASTDPQASRMLLVPEKPRRGVDTQTPFLLLLRKWIRGARLIDVTQPPWERVLILHFSGRAGECRLAVELMGRYSNIVLVGADGTVLDAIKHVTSRMSRYRTTLPGQPYQQPPRPKDRNPPTMFAEEGWSDKLMHAPLDEPLHQWLVSQLLGVSRVVARELAVRTTGDAAAPVRACTPRKMAAAIHELFMPLSDGWWTPHIAFDEAGSVIAFTPYEPRQFAQTERAADISQAMWRFFEDRGMTDPYAAARKSVRDLITDTSRRLENRLSNLREELGDEVSVSDLRTAGELLLIYQNQVPAGASEVSLPGYDGAPRIVVLNPELTPVENAQAYFRRYEKMRRAADHIPGLVEKLESQKIYLDQLECDLTLAESRPEIDAVRDSLAAAGWARRRRRKMGAQLSEPRRFEVDGFRIYVGRNSRQNEQITFKRAGPEDLWLHVRGLPGAHVIIRRGRQEVPEDIILRAAGLAAYFSRARDSESQVAVDVTERRFVRRMRGRHPGMVTYRNERTVWVADKEIQEWAEDVL